MAITPTPYGASTSSASNFSCILSDPDTGQLTFLARYRYVPRESMSADLVVPRNTFVRFDQANSLAVTLLPAGIESQGVYRCQAESRGLSTTVPVTILATESK